MKKQPSIFGGACIIASVCVGAGMLGIPSAGAGAWTLLTTLVLLGVMVLMTASGWMLLEAFKRYEFKVSFDTVTKDLLGSKVNMLNNVSVYFVGGILLYAYITTSGLILQDVAGLNSKVASILFVAIFSAIVWHSTRAVDRASVLLIIFMALSFIFGVSGLAAKVDFNILLDSASSDSSYSPYVFGLFSVALASFGYHHSASSMRDYYECEHTASKALMYGTLIALALYLLWIISIYGNLPRQNFGEVIAKGGDVDALLAALSSVIDSDSVSNAINIFSMAAILSSFIGVGLGVFDFLADFFKFENSRQGRTKAWAVTFIPPLVLSLLFPFGFVIAIGYAGAVATIWGCIIPACLAFKTRKLQEQEGKAGEGFVTPGGNFMIAAVIIFGVCTTLFHVLSMVGVLPTYTG